LPLLARSLVSGQEVEKSNYRGAASAIYNLAQKTNYFEGQLPNLAKAGIEAGFSYASQKLKNIFSAVSVELEDKVPPSVLKEAQNIVSNLNSKINIVGSNSNPSSITPISNNKKKEEIHR
jgi:uncharacterized protein (UPF0333 family)